MATAALVIALVSSSLTITQQTVGFVSAIKALHHHTTRQMYRHVLKPVGKAIKDAR